VAIEREKIRSGLLKKGFVEGGGHHDFYFLQIGGKRYGVFTKLSRGSGYKVYSDELVAHVCKQVGLRKKEFLDFIECPLELDSYVKILKERNRIR